MADKKIWYSQNYCPNLSVEDWKKLLQDKKIFSTVDLEIMKRFLDFGDNKIFQATFEQLAFTYGENYFFYQKNVEELGKKIFSALNCPIHEKIFKNILLEEREAGSFAMNYKFSDGSVDTKIYKLRDELADALLGTDLSEIKLYSDEKISGKIDFSSTMNFDNKKNKLVEKNLNRVILEKLRFAVLDANRKIPIKSWLDETDYRGYYILLNKNDSGLKNVLEKLGYVKKDPRLTDEVATKLLAKNLAYKISRKEFEDIETQFESGNKKFSPITPEEYENLKNQLSFA